MSRGWGRGLGRLLAAVVSLSCLSGVARAAPAMWEVSDGDSRLYLFGSMHVLSPKVRWRTAAFDRAYAQAGKLWFETRVDGDPRAMKGLVDRYGVDLDRTLTEKLPPRTIASLRAALDSHGTSLDRVDHLRPWAAAMMLSVLPMAQAGGTVQDGADAAVTRQAVRAEKPVVAFESFEQQMRLFADLPEAVEVEYLDDVAAEHNAPPRRGVDLQKAWLRGDIDRLGTVLVESMRRDRPEIYEALLRRRNLAWAETLDREMAGSGVGLVTVGALHMVGPDGLPALMKARGYHVRRVQ